MIELKEVDIKTVHYKAPNIIKAVEILLDYLKKIYKDGFDDKEYLSITILKINMFPAEVSLEKGIMDET